MSTKKQIALQVEKQTFKILKLWETLQRTIFLQHVHFQSAIFVENHQEIKGLLDVFYVGCVARERYKKIQWYSTLR